MAPGRRGWMTTLVIAAFIAMGAVLASGVVGYQRFKHSMSMGRALPMIWGQHLFHLDNRGGLWIVSEWTHVSTRFGDATCEPSGIPPDALNDVEDTPWPQVADEIGWNSLSSIRWLEVGWPLPCFVAVYATHSGDYRPIAGGKTLRGVDLAGAGVPGWLGPKSGETGWGHTILPTSVEWKPMAMNVAVWSLGAWFTLGIPGVCRGLRRSRRRRRGRCGFCGYDLRGVGSRCPECGSHRSSPAPSGGGVTRLCE